MLVLHGFLAAAVPEKVFLPQFPSVTATASDVLSDNHSIA